MKKSEKFMKVLSELGRDWQLASEISDLLEEYVCALYGSSIDSVEVTIYNMLMKKQTRENKAIDLSVLPPCFISLYLQMKRANFVAGMWKKTGSAQG